MKTSTAHAFINQMLAYTLAMICFTGSVGLGTVWLRHQISQTANATKEVERKINAIERRLAESTARLAGEQSPEMLESKNVSMALGLVPPRDLQIVRIEESPEDRLAAKRNIEIFANQAATGTVAVRFSVNN